ncbi:probable 2-oxoglutarate-dependent dioxygenase AOP1 isoform X2 [Sesamum indicum]|uniref:Probable 2-oxoglutarate-dependent dioxygenase AOP1 isoform X2 n=1 Tax=Sesamum indicum TaxID=4182 RepID=A0A6I9SQA5_SESIN|nr:probable 2-oxoglutarate-dependent dioxygenase AOP1 isoform X2 [Sesamum indicum]
MGSLVNPTLPTIHFSGKNLEPGSTAWMSTSKDVVRALEDYGCFAATYSKFSLGMHKAIFRCSEELFDLPTNVKVQNTSDTPSHGYVGQEPIIPLYEGLGIENATTREGVKKFTNLLWPSGNDRFCETALEYSRLVAELDQVVMRMVSESYGIESSYESLLGATSYLLRIIKYRKPEKGENGLGIVPHTDKSFMTIIHQCQVNGLEIKTKDGDWITVDPSPSSFIVMAGDAWMDKWKNRTFNSQGHN